MTLPVKPRQRPSTAKGVRHQKPADPFDTTSLRSVAAEKAFIAYSLQAFRGAAPADELAAAREVIGTLGREMFTVPEAGDAFLAMAEAITTDPPTMKDVVDAAKRQAAACGLDHRDVTTFIGSSVADATSIAAATRHASESAAEIRSLYESRRFINAAAGAVETVRRAGLTPEIVAQCIEQLATVEALVQRRGNGRRLRVRTASEIDPLPIEWLWPRRISRGSLTIITGLPGLSKSLLTIDIAARITTGGKWPDGTGSARKGGVILFGMEDPPETVVVPRLIAAGADLNLVRIVDGAEEGRQEWLDPISIDRDLDLVREQLDAFPECRAMIFDPLPQFVDVEENSNGQTRAALAPLVRLAQERDVTIIAVCHLNKKSDSAMIQRIAGASAYGQMARHILFVGHDPDDTTTGQERRRAMIVAKSSYGGVDTGQLYRTTLRSGDHPTLEWIAGTVERDAESLNPKPPGVNREYQEKRGEAVDALRESLEAGPRPGREVEADLDRQGFGRRQIDYAARVLKVVKRQTRDGGRREWTWSLPFGDAAEPEGVEVGTFTFDHWGRSPK